MDLDLDTLEMLQGMIEKEMVKKQREKKMKPDGVMIEIETMGMKPLEEGEDPIAELMEGPMADMKGAMMEDEMEDDDDDRSIEEILSDDDEDEDGRPQTYAAGKRKGKIF